MPRTTGQKPHTNRLTDRETAVLKLLADGDSNLEASEKLGLSRRTVEAHRARIMLKLNLHTLPDLVKYSIKNNLVEV